MSTGFLVTAVFVLGAGVWVLHKIGRALASILEVLAALAVVFVALWWLCKAAFWLASQVVLRWRTSLTVVAAYVWCGWLGWPSLAVVLGSVASVLGVWAAIDRISFDQWCGRFLRAWWLRWALYGRKLPGWLHACGLSIKNDALPVVVTVNLVRRRSVARSTTGGSSSGVQVPKVLGVRSGPSWDEVRVQLVPGQKPEDFDEAARASGVGAQGRPLPDPGAGTQRRVSRLPAA